MHCFAPHSVLREFLRSASSPWQKSPASGTTGETACPTTRHRQLRSLVGQAFSLSGFLPRAAKDVARNAKPAQEPIAPHSVLGELLGSSPHRGSKHRKAAVVLAGYCAFLQLYATQPLLPMLRGVFHTGEVAVSLTVTVASLGVAISAPFAGMLADRIGRRPVIVWSAFLLALTALATASATTLPQLLAWRFLQGVFTPGVFAVTVAYINDEWREAGAGRVVAAYISGTVLGGFSSRILSGLAAAHAPSSDVSLLRVFLVLGSLGLALAVVIAFWLPPEERRRESVAERGNWAAVAAHLANRELLATFLVGFCVLFSLVGVFTYVTFHLAAPPYSLQPGALGSIFFVYLAGAVATPLAGRAIDRFGHRRTLASAIAVSISGVALTLGGPLSMVVAGLAVCCSGVFSAQASASAFVGSAAQQNRGLAVGLYATFYYLGGSAGAFAPGLFYAWGGWPACAAFIAAVQAITILIALLYWKPVSQR
jgi:YNFM family putative membrane transporter